jgi:hypothetical protein
LRYSPTGLVSRDEEQLVDTRERGSECLGLVVVATADLHAALGEAGSLARAAYYGDDLGRWDTAALKQA